MNIYDWNKLVNKLLSIGGERVVEVYETDLEKLLTRGEIITGRIRSVKRWMKPCRCHQNSATFFKNYVSEKGKENINIITGWGLSEDGLWRQHTWLKIKNEIIETTVKRKIYFGVILKDKEIDEFCFFNL